MDNGYQNLKPVDDVIYKMFDKVIKIEIKKYFSDEELKQLDNELQAYYSDYFIAIDFGPLKKGDKIKGLLLINQMTYLKDKEIISFKGEISDKMQTLSEFPEIKINESKVKEYAEFERKLNQLNDYKKQLKLGKFGL